MQQARYVQLEQLISPNLNPSRNRLPNLHPIEPPYTPPYIPPYSPPSPDPAPASPEPNPYVTLEMEVNETESGMEYTTSGGDRFEDC
jgi:hypothetical protein